GGGNVRGVAKQCETGDVRGAASADGEGRAAGVGVEGAHRGVERRGVGFVEQTALLRCGEEPGTDPFREDEDVADGGVGVAEDAARIGAAGHGDAELELFVDDGVATDDDRAGLVDLVLPAAQDFGEDLERQLAGGETDDVERGERLAAHGVDVGEGVGGGDLAEGVGVVDDRREEVDGLDEREIVGEDEHAGVVEGLAPDEEPGIGVEREGAEGGREIAGPELGGAPGTAGERRQPDALAGARDGRGRYRNAHMGISVIHPQLRYDTIRILNSACRPGRHGTATMASISTSTPRGSADTCTVDRAGRASPSARPYTSFTTGKSFMSWRYTVVFTTFAQFAPTVASTAARLAITRSVCAATPPPTTCPVAGSIAICPAV